MKPSCEGIFDILTGQYLKDNPPSESPECSTEVGGGDKCNTGKELSCPFTKRFRIMKRDALRDLIYDLDPTMILPTATKLDQLKLIALEQLKKG